MASVELGKNVFNDCKKLASVKLPSVIIPYDDNYITSYFTSCPLEKVEFNPGVTEIPKELFAYSGIKSFEIPSTVNTIASYAFYECNNLTSITIPSGVTSIGTDAFAYSDNLVNVTISGTPEIGKDAFANTPYGDSLGVVSVSEELESEYEEILSSAEETIAVEENELYEDITSTESEYAEENTTDEDVSMEEVVEVPDFEKITREVTYTNLRPNEIYTFYSERTVEFNDYIEEDKLLFIDNFTADSEGKLTITYTFTSDSKEPFERIVRIASDNIVGAVITGVEDKPYTGEVYTTVPVVTYNGVVLTENVDYYVSGVTETSEVGTYIIVIEGRGDYIGIQAVSYSIIAEETPIEQFVERLYATMLGRASDAGGKAKWVEKLNNGATAADIAVNFVLSPELKQQKLSNETFVKRMYQTMLDRTPADKEVANWASYLEAGCTYAFVFRGFLTAPEFSKLCASYGIKTGTYAATENRDVNGKLTKFISRLYTKALNRAYDVGGLNHHTGNYISGKYTLDVIASGFILSPEFEKRKLSDENFVECMYNTFFDRASDASGKAKWLQKMANGMTREEVFNGFVISPEYKALVKSFGL